MKKILVFIGLKVAEIAGIVFIPWGIGLFEKKLGWLSIYLGISSNTPVWMLGMVVVVLLFVLFVVCLVISKLVLVNWRWAGRLAEDKKEKSK